MRSGASIVIHLNKRTIGILIEGSSLAFLLQRHSRRTRGGSPVQSRSQSAWSRFHLPL